MTPAARDALLPAIAAGDAEAFAEWLSQAEPRIRASLCRYAALVDTEAVLQESLLRVWQVAPRIKLDEQGDSLLRLGVRIARNLAVDYVRVERRRAGALEGEQPPLDLEHAEEPGAAPQPPDPWLRKAISECAAELPKQPARALFSRIENQGAHADERLAEGLGMKLNTFLKNFGRARQLLLACLERRGVELPFLHASGAAGTAGGPNDT